MTQDNDAECTEARLTETGFVYFGNARLDFCIVKEGLRFGVKETWLRPRYGLFIVVTWDELDRLRRLTY